MPFVSKKQHDAALDLLQAAINGLVTECDRLRRDYKEVLSGCVGVTRKSMSVLTIDVCVADFREPHHREKILEMLVEKVRREANWL